jgi:hypothetical protein
MFLVQATDDRKTRLKAFSHSSSLTNTGLKLPQYL